MLKLTSLCYHHLKKINMEPKHVIGLSLQGSEHKRNQKIELGAALKAKYSPHGHNV